MASADPGLTCGGERPGRHTGRRSGQEDSPRHGHVRNPGSCPHHRSLDNSKKRPSLRVVRVGASPLPVPGPAGGPGPVPPLPRDGGQRAGTHPPRMRDPMSSLNGTWYGYPPWHGWKSSPEPGRWGRLPKLTTQWITGLCRRSTAPHTAMRLELSGRTVSTRSCFGGRLACLGRWRLPPYPGLIGSCWRVPRHARTSAFIERPLTQSFCVSPAAEPLHRWPSCKETISSCRGVRVPLPGSRRR